MGKFYQEEAMLEARATLEAEVMLWPQAEVSVLLDCPTYLSGGHPFAVLVDGSILVPQLSDEVLQGAHPDSKVEPMEYQGLHLPGWLRVLARTAEDVKRALPLVRAAYDARASAGG